MGEIVLKVPKRRHNVQLIQAEKMLNDIITARQEKLKEKFGLEEIRQLLELERQKEEEERKRKEDEEFLKLVEHLKEEEEIGNIYLANNKEENVETDTETKVENNLENNLESNVESEISESKSFEDRELLSKNDIDDVSEVTIDALNSNVIAEALKNEPEIDIGLPEDRIALPDKTIFTEIYSISEVDTPIQITHSSDKNTIDIELAEKYVQEAYDRGYEDCKEVAALNAQTKINEAHNHIRKIDKLVFELRKHYANKLQDFNDELINLSCMIAEVIIENEIQRDHNIVIKQIEKAINELNEDAVFSVTIHPDDAKILEEAKSTLSKNSKSFAATIISTDSSIERGGCILRTSAGNIDATINTQIGKLRAELKIMSEEKKGQTIPLGNENIPEIETPTEDALEPLG